MANNDGLDPMRSLTDQIPPEILNLIRAAHTQVAWNCNARGEGLWCCIDALIGDA